MRPIIALAMGDPAGWTVTEDDIQDGLRTSIEPPNDEGTSPSSALVIKASSSRSQTSGLASMARSFCLEPYRIVPGLVGETCRCFPQVSFSERQGPAMRGCEDFARRRCGSRP